MTPRQTVAVGARLFGVWLLLEALDRIFCAHRARQERFYEYAGARDPPHGHLGARRRGSLEFPTGDSS